MNYRLRSSLVVCAAIFLAVICARGADAEFQPLFNGKDFTGWRFSAQKEGDPWPDNWKVKDGVIFLTGGGKPIWSPSPSMRTSR